MIQIIITGIIITVAVLLAVFLLVRYFRKNKKADPCKDCGSDCGGCELKEAIRKGKKKS